MGTVHVFVSAGLHPTAESLHAYVRPSWADGAERPSAFMREAGVEDFEPMCVEAVHLDDLDAAGPLPPARLLRDASYAGQWLPRLTATAPVEAAVCVYSPNVVTTPQGTAMRYLGGFPYHP